MAPISVGPKLLRRFYEPLLLLDALGQVRGKHIKPEAAVDTSSAITTKNRRSFVDGIAYICAFQKGPDYVTAVALEKTQNTIKVWLAANRGIQPGVVEFLQGILVQVQRTVEHNGGDAGRRAYEQTLEKATTDVLIFNAPRIQSYYRIVAGYYVQPCLGAMRAEYKRSGNSDTDNQSQMHQLIEWLHKHFVIRSVTEVHELCKLARECHSLRSSSFFEPLKLFTRQGQAYWHEFEQLHKLLCKLGKHVTVTRKLLEAAIRLPSDFASGFTVHIVPSSKYQKFPLKSSEASVESTLGRMFSSSEARDNFRQRLQSLWDTDEVSKILQKIRKTSTQVHAELLLIDYLDRYGCTFLGGNDKYIGCSKPACYLCHAYISYHPGNYIVPASHQKLYVGWRLPDIEAETVNCNHRLDSQVNILRKLIDKVRQDLEAEIESHTPRRPFHADSTAGVTSDPGVYRAVGIDEWLERMSVNGTVIDDKTLSDYLETESQARSRMGSEAEHAESSDDDEGGIRVNHES